jgi:hypothetical protein
MNATITEIFGYIVLVASVVLFVWEYRMFMARPESDTWLITRRRFRRRALISGVLTLIGALLVIEARGILNLRRPIHLVVYVLVLTTLAIVLLILAGADLSDTLRAAQQQAMVELEEAVQAERIKIAGSRDSGQDPGN